MHYIYSCIAMFIPFLCNANQAFELKVYDRKGIVYTFTIDELQSLPRKELKTALPWLEGENVFSGFTLPDLLKENGLSMPTMVNIVALNGYRVAIPKSDIINYDPIIAFKMFNKYMEVRDKGPYWLVFPLSKFKEIDTVEYHAKMIWQIKEIYLY
ncbi:hypothetical protein [Vibrio sagamiensis]|nr:hypothetical protein [Vibrio sagamiensis]